MGLAVSIFCGLRWLGFPRCGRGRLPLFFLNPCKPQAASDRGGGGVHLSRRGGEGGSSINSSKQRRSSLGSGLRCHSCRRGAGFQAAGSGGFPSHRRWPRAVQGRPRGAASHGPDLTWGKGTAEEAPGGDTKLGRDDEPDVVSGGGEAAGGKLSAAGVGPGDAGAEDMPDPEVAAAEPAAAAAAPATRTTEVVRAALPQAAMLVRCGPSRHVVAMRHPGLLPSFPTRRLTPHSPPTFPFPCAHRRIARDLPLCPHCPSQRSPSSCATRATTCQCLRASPPGPGRDPTVVQPDSSAFLCESVDSWSQSTTTSLWPPRRRRPETARRRWHPRSASASTWRSGRSTPRSPRLSPGGTSTGPRLHQAGMPRACDCPTPWGRRGFRCCLLFFPSSQLEGPLWLFSPRRAGKSASLGVTRV